MKKIIKMIRKENLENRENLIPVKKCNMKKNILFIGLLMISTILSSQIAPDTAWTRMYGGGFFDWAWQVEQTTDGGYIVIADYSHGGMNYDAWLIKTDSNGDILWTKTFGGLAEDRGQSVQQTTDGGYIIAGTTSSFGNGSYDIWLIKTDEFGNEIWSKTFGGTSWDWGYFVQQTTDGGYIITGCKDPGAYYIWDVFLIKTDSQGNTSWTKTYGGDDYDVGHCVRQTTDGGYIITGYTYSYGAGSSDVWLIKTDPNGNESWSQTFGGNNPEHGYSVIQTIDEGYTIVGYTKSFGAGDYDVWLINTDNDGNEIWNKTFGGINDDRAYSVQQTIDGEYIIAGFTESFGAGNYDMWLIKTLSNGDTLWTKTIGGENLDRGRYVQQTTDNGYIVVGDTYIFEQGEYNVYIVKVNPETSEQQITLNNGYSFVSSRIIPENPDMLIVMAPVLNDNLDFVRNSNGQMLRKIGPNWVNNIGDWLVSEGYLVKMFADDSFTINGTLVDLTTPISVEAGFQFVSYFPKNTMDALIAFETILGDDLDFIRNSNGEMLRKIGPNWVNGIGDCLPGEGYLVKMFADGEIIYPATAKSSSKR